MPRKKTINRCAIAELVNRGYHNRHVAIVMGCSEDMVLRIKKEEGIVEPTLKFLTHEQKQRLLVVDKLLELKPVSRKWCSNDYYYITILKFLLVPREAIYEIYKGAPMRQKAMAHKENAPLLKKFDYTCLGVNSEEWGLFVIECYKILGAPDKWK